jgi:hypothetical protein
MTRARNRDGTFKSAFDVELERQEAEWNAEIKAKMDGGMSFDEAWIASGGSIISHDELRLENAVETASRWLAQKLSGDGA